MPFSIFSIYFVSPIVHGMREHRIENQEAPAKRLVLIVGKKHSLLGLRSTNKYIRRRTARRQGLPVFPRPLAIDRKRRRCRRATPTRSLSPVSRVGTRDFWRIAHQSSYRIQTWPCCTHCWIIRRRVCGYDRVEAEPGQFRQCVQSKSAYMELGKSGYLAHVRARGGSRQSISRDV